MFVIYIYIFVIITLSKTVYFSQYDKYAFILKANR